jgi:ribonuclease J
LEIQPVLVDHSVPGAYGLCIHTSEGCIVYTGDLRMHGDHGELTEAFVETASEQNPVAMITEGTRIDQKKTDESEKKVYNESTLELKNERHLSIVDFNFKDVARFNTFYRIARDLNKQLVISFKHACFLEKYHAIPPFQVPSSMDDHIKLLLPKRLTGTYSREDYVDQYIKKRLDYPNIITAEEIKATPNQYMVVLNFWYFNTLVDLKPRSGTYIHSLSEPFNEEMQLSYDRMLQWLDHFNLRFVQSHCSGHINGDDLRACIQTIKPSSLYPIHTEKPRLFKKTCEKTIMVKEGKTYKC